MEISYRKLWRLIIDRALKKKDLVQLGGISNYTLNKLNKSKNVTTDILVKICKALNCGIDEIMEIEHGASETVE